MSDGDEEPTESEETDAPAPDEPEAEEPANAPEESADTDAEATDAEDDSGEEDAGEDDVRAAERERYEELAADLDAAGEALEAAETEDDLDEVEADLEDIETAIEEADFTDPEEFQPDEEELEEEEEPEELLDFEEELTNELQDLQDDLEEQRGPYGEDVVSEIESAKSTVESTRWTDTGDEQVADAIDAFTDDVSEVLDADVAGDDVAALDAAAEAVTDAELDADDDEAEIATLLEATDTLQSGVDDSQAFNDLSSRQKLQYEGFYDVLNKHKDYPPEWAAVKEWTKRNNAEMVALCMEHFTSGYMEEHCLEAFVRMGNPDAIDVLKEKAQRRNLTAVKALGKTGHPDAVDGVADYIDSDSNPNLQKTALRAVGELGATEYTEDVAQWLVAENEDVRSQAARTLGLLGDTRAVAPLRDVLADDEETEGVRASAAWALYQIGTAEALEAAAEHTDTRSFLVQSEAEKAAAALN
ncbi:HEAT repeat domain-containing protein [Halarchaeum sp. P4]|uniref:HEAT repeat domain-containing protein n=1 Tax=Halarchaeum sp. P4 TaxID=3421639 RepID=UPI003EBBBE9F